MLNWILHLLGIQMSSKLSTIWKVKWRWPWFCQVVFKMTKYVATSWIKPLINSFLHSQWCQIDIQETHRCNGSGSHCTGASHPDNLRGVNVIVGLLSDVPYNGHYATCYGVIPARFQHFTPANLIFLQKIPNCCWWVDLWSVWICVEPKKNPQ